MTFKVGDIVRINRDVKHISLFKNNNETYEIISMIYDGADIAILDRKITDSGGNNTICLLSYLEIDIIEYRKRKLKRVLKCL